MKQRGEDVVILSIGDPDFRTPDPIIDNAVSHMPVGRTHYSPALGELNFRRAVADYETRTIKFFRSNYSMPKAFRSCLVVHLAAVPGGMSGFL